MSGSLYDINRDNSELRKDPRFRWQKFCIDIDLFKAKTRRIHTLTLNWQSQSFERACIPSIPATQGVYMFVVNANRVRNLNGTCKYVLYVGQASNLQDRFGGYFNYATNDEPSNLLKRIMVVVWEGSLDFHYFETPSMTDAELTEVEFDLIDTIIPPLNQRFRGRIVKKAVKLYAPR
jgi:hypothetical protein